MDQIPLVGSVAKTIAEDGRTGINWIRSPLCGGIEKSGNEDRLSSDIASADLSNLPLPDHRHCFETCQCSSGGSEPAEAEPRSDQTLDAPMILLDNIIQILALPETRTAPEFAVSLHLRDRPWIGGVPIPMMPPVCNGMIAPRDSWMMPPPCNEMIPPGAPRLLA